MSGFDSIKSYDVYQKLPMMPFGSYSNFSSLPFGAYPSLPMTTSFMNPSFVLPTIGGGLGLGIASSLNSNKTSEEKPTSSTIGSSYIERKIPQEVKVFNSNEVEILANEYKGKVIDPPSESLGSCVESQAAFFTLFGTPTIYNYATSPKTRESLSPVLNKKMNENWVNPTWKDFVKPSGTFKENQEFNNAVKDLIKATGKLERKMNARAAKKVDLGLYNKILNRAEQAIKSGDIEKVKAVLAEAELAKKAKSVKAFTAAKKAAKAKSGAVAVKTAEKAVVETAEKTVEKAALESAEKVTAEAAGKASLKTMGKSIMKTCSKYTPYVGDVIFAGVEIAGDWDKLKAAKEKGGGALAKQCIHTGVKTAAVVGGFAAGMKAGAAIGTVIGTIFPGIGNVVGAVIGAVAGGIIGGVLSWAGAKLAKGTTKLFLGEEPGVTAQVEKKKSKENNQYSTDGKLDMPKFQASGENDMAMSLAQIYAANGTGKDGISEEAAQVLRKYGYIDSPAQTVNYAA